MDFDGKAQGMGLGGEKKKKDSILKAVVKQLTHVYQSGDMQTGTEAVWFLLYLLTSTSLVA